jgi:glucose-6-phosphate isomerase
MGILTFDTRWWPEELRQDARGRAGAAMDALQGLRSGSCVGAEWTGWFDWPRRRAESLEREVRSFVSGFDAFFDLVLVVGIGGSYLGCRAVSDALAHPHAALLGKSGRAARRPALAYAGQHLSEAGLVEVLDLLEERQPVVVVISKSGTTTEPAVAFRVIRDYMEKRFGRTEAARRIVAVTDARKGALRKLSDEYGYASFPVPDDVGGRYSVLTAVGLVPLALAGYDVGALLQGADAVYGEVRDGDVTGHAILEYAALRNAAFAAGKRIELLATAEPKLTTLVQWWQQLFGESEGKQGLGLFPAGLCYTTDLHSLGQYVQDGCRNLIETVLSVSDAPARESLAVERRLRVPQASSDIDEIGYLEGRFVGEVNRAATLGTIVAHADGGVPCASLTAPRLDERTLGALFAFFQTACGVSGAMLGVNPYDQPGVEAYKKNLFGLLGKPGFETLGAELRRRL